ncbi:lysophospholipase [Pendulispora brunnea]|uniref:Lysophospholipase n=1 Tax=Pendulispora brunnea TaxID=2905690 RepID=A0ABZ2KKD0_9BACT
MDPSKGYQSGYIQGEDSAKLFWQRWCPPEQMKGTVIIVHDLKDHGARYAELALGLLVPAKYGVYALDLRGHGQSDGERGYVDDFDRYVRDLDAFVRHVKKEEWATAAASTPFVLGHGTGGTIAAHYATTSPPIRGVAISGAWLRQNISALVLQGLRMADTPSREPAKATFYGLDLNDYSSDPAVVEQLRKDPLVQNGRLPARTALQMTKAINRLREKAKNISLPLLVLHGEGDRIAPIQGAKDVFDTAGSQSKLLRTYPGCAHDLWHEPEPNRARIRRDLVAWLNATA